MDIIDFPERTLIISGPERGQPQYQPLPVHISEIDDHRHWTSCWRPTSAELEEINRTGVIWLTVTSEAHPPVRVDALGPLVYYRDIERIEAKRLTQELNDFDLRILQIWDEHIKAQANNQ